MKKMVQVTIAAAILAMTQLSHAGNFGKLVCQDVSVKKAPQIIRTLEIEDMQSQFPEDENKNWGYNFGFLKNTRGVEGVVNVRSVRKGHIQLNWITLSLRKCLDTNCNNTDLNLQHFHGSSSVIGSLESPITGEVVSIKCTVEASN